MNFGTAAMRGIVGPLFIGHGTQKLFGWFGGAAGAIGGPLLPLGALTPVAASLVTGVMTTAIRKVHAKNGPWVTGGGWEYNAVLIAAVTAIADHGPRGPSVDGALLPRFKGPAWALLAVGAGVAGSYLVTSEAMNPAPQEGPAERSG